jgi:hypothetical protein
MKVGKVTAGVLAIALIAGIACGVKAQTPDEEGAKQDMHDAKAVAKRHRAELMKIPHVRVVTAEIDAQNNAAVLIEVDDQKNVDEVTRHLPSELEGFPVEVGEDDSIDESGRWGEGVATAMPTPVPPEVDQNGIYGRTWQPATNPEGSQ